MCGGVFLVDGRGEAGEAAAVGGDGGCRGGEERPDDDEGEGKEDGNRDLGDEAEWGAVFRPEAAEAGAESSSGH